MMLDQNELDQMLAEGVDGEEAGAAAAPPPPSSAPLDLSKVPDDVRRLLKLKVPVIVQLANRRISVGQARKLSLGLILEFTKQVHEDLELLVNNREVGTGEAVKVGEKFGLRINAIQSREDRIRALGGGDDA